MPTEVRSPISRLGSRAGSFTGELSPGARSDPSRGDRRRDSGGEPEPSLPINHQAQEPDKPKALRRDQDEPRERERDEPARGDAVPVQQSMLDYYLHRSLGAASIKIGRPGEDY